MVSFDTNIILLGASGAGKGTQAEKLKADYGWQHLEAGEILRNLAKEDSPLGKKIAQKIDRGVWTPDNLVNEIIEAEIKKVPKDRGIIFDGYPRTIGQAKFLDDVLKKEGRKKPIVVYFWVRPEKLVFRLLNRKICDRCNQLFYPPQSLKQVDCACGGKLIRRSDDTEEIIKNRIGEYQEKTAKLVGYFRKAGSLIKINGEPSIEEVWQDLKDVLSRIQK